MDPRQALLKRTNQDNIEGGIIQGSWRTAIADDAWKGREALSGNTSSTAGKQQGEYLKSYYLSLAGLVPRQHAFKIQRNTEKVNSCDKHVINERYMEFVLTLFILQTLSTISTTQIQAKQTIIR